MESFAYPVCPYSARSCFDKRTKIPVVIKIFADIIHYSNVDFPLNVVRHGGLTWHSSQRGLLVQRGMTATQTHGMKSSI
jgi:hypothetical protein